MGEPPADDLENMAARAVASRIDRLRNHMGFGFLGASLADYALRALLSRNLLIGTNMLVFGFLAFSVYSFFKPRIQAGTSTLAWRGRSPWLLVYWPLAGLLILLSLALFF